MMSAKRILFLGSSHIGGLKEAWEELYADDKNLSADFEWASEVAWALAGSYFRLNDDIIDNKSAEIKSIYNAFGKIEGEFGSLPSIRNLSFRPTNYHAIALFDGAFGYTSCGHFFKSTDEAILFQGVPVSSSLCFDLDIRGLGKVPGGPVPLLYLRPGSREIFSENGEAPGYEIAPLLDLIRTAAPNVKLAVLPDAMPIRENLPSTPDFATTARAIGIYNRLSDQFCLRHGTTFVPTDQSLLCKETGYTEKKYSRGQHPSGEWDSHLTKEYYAVQLMAILKALEIEGDEAGEEFFNDAR